MEEKEGVPYPHHLRSPTIFQPWLRLWGAKPQRNLTNAQTSWQRKQQKFVATVGSSSKLYPKLTFVFASHIQNIFLEAVLPCAARLLAREQLPLSTLLLHHCVVQHAF